MARKDNQEEVSQEVSQEAPTEQQVPVQIVSDSQLLNLKLDKIIELLTQK
jgi:hypothetical protein